MASSKKVKKPTKAKATSKNKKPVKKPTLKAQSKNSKGAKSPTKNSAKPAAKTSSDSKGSRHSLLATFMTPLDQRVVVQVDAFTGTTAGGLILTEAAKPNRGKVIAVGRGHLSKKGKLKPLDVAVGDRVLYAEHAGTSVDWHGHNLLILREDEILGVIT